MRFTFDSRFTANPWLAGSMLFAASLAAIGGCGGAGSAVSAGGAPAPAPESPAREVVSAKLTVDARSGKVLVDPLSSPDGRAAYTNGGITLSSTELVDEPGSTGRKVLSLWVRNRLEETIGVNGGLRVTLSGFANLTATPTDVGSQTDVSTIAGSAAGGTGDGSALGDVIQDVGAMCWDSDGIYFTTRTDGKVKKLKNGQVTTLASGLLNPSGIATMGNASYGYLLVSDTGRNRIVKVPSNGGAPVVVSGSPAGAAGDVLGDAATARYNAPMGLYVSAMRAGLGSTEYRLYVADSNNNKVKVVTDPTGAATASAFAATSGKPQQLTGGYVGAEFMVFATTKNNVVQATVDSLTPPPFATVAGTGVAGSTEGSGNAAQFNDPQGIVFANGALYVADKGNFRVRQLTLPSGGSPGSISSWKAARFAGAVAGFGDGTGAVASFNSPQGIAYDPNLGVLVGDLHRVRRIAAPRIPFVVGADGGAVSTAKVTVANPEGYSGAERPYFYTRGSVDPQTADSTPPIAFIVPDNVNMFSFNVMVEGENATPAVLDAREGNGSPDVMAARMAGAEQAAFQDGIGTAARFHSARGMHLVPSGALYIADKGNNAIRRMTPQGEVRTILGHPSKSASIAGGTGVAASIPSPNAVWISDDETEGLILTDTMICRISRSGGDPSQMSSWTLALIAGNVAQMVEGNGNVARFNGLRDVVKISENEFMLCDSINGRIRRMTQIGADKSKPESWNFSTYVSAMAKPVGIVRALQGDFWVLSEFGALYQMSGASTFALHAGSTSLSGYSDGPRVNARFGTSTGVAVDKSGAVFISEAGSGRIRRVSQASQRVGTVLKGGGAAEGRGSAASLGLGVTNVELMPDGDLYATDGMTIWTVRKIIGS